MSVRDHPGVSALKAANLAVKFILELAAIAAFALWGASLDGVLVSAVVVVGAPASVVVLWGVFAAPRSSRRLPTPARVLFGLSVFALAAAALLALDWVAIAIAIAAVVVVNAFLLARLDQWEQ